MVVSYPAGQPPWSAKRRLGRRTTATTPREVLMDRELVTRHEQTLLRAMASVGDCQNVLGRLDRQWTRATLTGKINCSRIAQTLIDFIITTQDNFAALQKNLVDTLVLENTQKVVL